MINAIILAAGESKRMGKPKSLLLFDENTFLEHIALQLKYSFVDRTTIVFGADAGRINREVSLSGVHPVMHKDYKKGQFSSLIAGLKSVPAETEAVLVCLVDHPFITKDIVNQMIAIYKENKPPVIVPVYQGHRGYPVLFSSSVFHELLSAPKNFGDDYVVNEHEENVFEFEAEEKGVIVGINTPKDYNIFFGTEP